VDDVTATPDPAATSDPRAGGLPVTVVVSRRPVPGREAELLAWAEGIRSAASTFPGHLGAEIYAPSAPDRDELVIAFSFASAADLSAWEHSAERRDWLARGERLVAGPTRTHAVGGFESLFATAPGQAVVPPPKWKTALIIAMALYPASLLLNWLLPPYIGGWPLAVRVLVTTALIVPIMVWLGVPYLSRWLRRWLHP
jgi:antibiotic biosynthesis monooxygenase (ABM) superfamily enzyme